MNLCHLFNYLFWLSACWLHEHSNARLTNLILILKWVPAAVVCLSYSGTIAGLKFVVKPWVNENLQIIVFLGRPFSFSKNAYLASYEWNDQKENWSIIIKWQMPLLCSQLYSCTTSLCPKGPKKFQRQKQWRIKDDIIVYILRLKCTIIVIQLFRLPVVFFRCWVISNNLLILIAFTCNKVQQGLTFLMPFRGVIIESLRIHIPG